MVKIHIAKAQMKKQFIKFLQDADLAITKRDFYRMVKFPGVKGAIDETHIPIINPGGQDSARFGNRKGYYSINTQIVYVASMKVTNMVARWPGATYDSCILQKVAGVLILETNLIVDTCLVTMDMHAVNTCLRTSSSTQNNIGTL